MAFHGVISQLLPVCRFTHPVEKARDLWIKVDKSGLVAQNASRLEVFWRPLMLLSSGRMNRALTPKGP